MDEHVESSKLEEVTTRESLVQELSLGNHANDINRLNLLKEAFGDYLKPASRYQGGN